VSESETCALFELSSTIFCYATTGECVLWDLHARRHFGNVMTLKKQTDALLEGVGSIITANSLSLSLSLLQYLSPEILDDS
jgi:hypothetical protein